MSKQIILIHMFPSFFCQLESVSVKQGDNLAQKDSVNTAQIKTELEKSSVSFAFVDGRIIDVCEHTGKLSII